MLSAPCSRYFVVSGPGLLARFAVHVNTQETEISKTQHTVVVVRNRKYCPGEVTDLSTASPLLTYATGTCRSNLVVKPQVVVGSTGLTIAAHLSRPTKASPASPRQFKAGAIIPAERPGAAGRAKSPQTPPRDTEAARDRPTIVVGPARVVPTMD